MIQITTGTERQTNKLLQTVQQPSIIIGMDDKKSPSNECKKAGLKSLEELSTITAVPRSTLNAWPTTKPKLWQAVLKGAAQIKKEQSQSSKFEIISFATHDLSDCHRCGGKALALKMVEPATMVTIRCPTCGCDYSVGYIRSDDTLAFLAALGKAVSGWNAFIRGVADDK